MIATDAQFYVPMLVIASVGWLSDFCRAAQKKEDEN